MTRSSPATETLLPCPVCGMRPGQKVGPPAMARCVTTDCPGTKLAAVTLAEWNTRASLQPATPTAGDIHRSDCAVHNAPALPVGPCDCGAELASSGVNSPSRRTGAVGLVSVQDTPSATAGDAVAGEAKALADEVQNYFDRDYFGPKSKDLRDRIIAALRSPDAAATPQVSLKRMGLSDGRTDYFVMIKVGDREVSPHVFREEYKAAYHVALYDWLLTGRGEEPEIVAFGPHDWPARSIHPAQPSSAPTDEQIEAGCKARHSPQGWGRRLNQPNMAGWVTSHREEMRTILTAALAIPSTEGK